MLLVNFSHNYENGWTPLLKINKATVISTSESPGDNFRNSIENVFIKDMLNAVGINNATWYNNAQTSYGTDEQRQAFLKKIEELV